MLKKISLACSLVLLFSAIVLTQSSGTPKTLRVKIDANGYLVASAIGGQTAPLTTTTFSNARLKVDANGYLQVVVTGSPALSGLTVDTSTIVVNSTNHNVGFGIAPWSTGIVTFANPTGQAGPSVATLGFGWNSVSSHPYWHIISSTGSFRWVETGVQDNRFVIKNGGGVTIGDVNGNPIGGIDVNGNVTGASYQVGATAGVSCAVNTPAHLTVVNGIVTVCN